MKKIKHLIVFCTGLSLLIACGSSIKESSIPAKVKASFAKQFPGTTAKWEKEDGKYEAGFKQGDLDKSVLIDENGTILESESAIPLAELPQVVKDSINTHYHNPVIKEAAKIVLANGEIQYEAVIGTKDFIFDANGNEVKKTID